MLLTTSRIIGERLYIRCLEEQDATGEYCSWLNDPEVNKFLETRESTMIELREYIKKRIADPHSLFLGIFMKATDQHIGNVKLEPIDWSTKRATIGLLIGNKHYWGKGIGTEATRLVVTYALTELGLQQIELGVLEEHKAAIKVYEKIGFKAIYVDKEAIRHGDKLFNRVVMVLSKN